MDSRRGLEMWGPVGRWVFLNWPRGSWQYDLICGAIIAGLFILPSPEPQNADLAAVLAGIEAANDATGTFTADFVSTERIPVFDSEEVERGTVSFLKPSFIRRDIREPGSRIEVVAEGEITIYIPRIKQARIMSIGERGGDGANIDVPGMGSSAALQESFDVTLQETTADAADGATVYVLRLLPKPDTAAARHYRSINLHVAEGEWHPARQIVVEEHNGSIITMVLSNVDRAADLEPGDFRLQLPADVDVIRQGPTDRP